MQLKEYIPFKEKKFRKGQEEAINDVLKSIEEGNRFTILNAPVGVGKAFCLNTIVPTDSGFKKIKNIKIGDYVFDDQGQKVKVLNKSQVWHNRPCFKITFKNGFEIIADENHEWICNYNIDTKQTKEFRKRTTKEMYENYKTREKYRHYIKKPSPMQYSKKQLPIAPYTLGIWLSDGSADSSDITVNNLDLTIWDEIENEGLQISAKYRPKGNANTSAILNFHHLLRENNLIKNKHIPDCYFNASYEDRLSLIQGLIDGDGYVNPEGYVEFSNNNYQIVKGLKILLSSFGIETRIRSRIPKLYGKPCNRNYRLSFRATQDVPITRLPRYQQNIKTSKRQWNTTYSIYSIEPAGFYDTVCIQVEGGIFCVGEEYIPTHNSLIGYVLAKTLEKDNLHTYLCTGTKILQDQYIKDFTDVKTIKGRNNFKCISEPLFDCANGLCKTKSKFKCTSKPILQDEWVYKNISVSPSNIENFYGDMCNYWFNKLNGIFAPITMLNYDYLISDTRFVRQLPKRKLLVCDEAHNIENVLMRQLELRFSPRAVERETGFSFNANNTIKQWASSLSDLSDIYQGKMKRTESDEKRKKYKERAMQFDSLSGMMEEDPDNWVFAPEKYNNNIIFVFKPIKVTNYTSFIFNVADHILLMTGTILKQDLFAGDLGINDFKYIEVPSIIPPENRPIIKMYVGSMARSSIEKTMPDMISTVGELAEKHKNEKGVIHTFTYNISRRFQQAFGNNDRFIFHNQKNKDDAFKTFKEDNTNKILVSPVAFEGVDFPYDQARWQCICKDPFPNIGDPQIKARELIDFDWTFRQRCLVLSQMYGRSNRAEDDWSITYLLDSRIESLLGPSSLVTDYFYEAIENSHYNDELILNENAYEKLTKDNSRKNHSFDREVERNILQDIENGYNSLSSLRKEYKKFHSDAYKYIGPAVERLLKHGAIKYR